MRTQIKQDRNPRIAIRETLKIEYKKSFTTQLMTE